LPLSGSARNPNQALVLRKPRHVLQEIYCVQWVNLEPLDECYSIQLGFARSQVSQRFTDFRCPA
jgi:hypothetical protein